MVARDLRGPTFTDGLLIADPNFYDGLEIRNLVQRAFISGETFGSLKVVCANRDICLKANNKTINLMIIMDF